ncbi:hypothetical protein DFJ74DRAFT_762850 [Hyaloraphidium curvatum]|nr:hypothetical protein DFJ74DRAFT_762850 [Hyaloraphidium curvatum]
MGSQPMADKSTGRPTARLRRRSQLAHIRRRPATASSERIITMSVLVLGILLDRALSAAELRAAPPPLLAAAGVLSAAGAARGWLKSAPLRRPAEALSTNADHLLHGAKELLAAVGTTGALPAADARAALRWDISRALADGRVALAHPHLTVVPPSALVAALCAVTALAGHLGADVPLLYGLGTGAVLLGSLMAGHALAVWWQQRRVGSEIRARNSELEEALGSLQAGSGL